MVGTRQAGSLPELFFLLFRFFIETRDPKREKKERKKKDHRPGRMRGNEK